MAYNKVNWENGTIRQEGHVTIDGVQYQTVQPEYEGATPINADNLNHMDEGIKQLSDAEVKKAVYTVAASPSTTRGTTGFGETYLDISALDAEEILGVTFGENSTHTLWACRTDITTKPDKLQIYCYRMAGTYAGNMSTKVFIMYK